ncbi:hypothetical protein nbrc107697_33990 [Gordonia crocea]|uniref:Secreted protein n=1 Tax=Gordonia crocea TaxID=589162 RepID=A0A7I9V2V0_9ACTN|nr:hypothetical protein nbrc107697_30270 [Gordonia crocea]GED99360.1 hypothetical protein nbrc107697_33990 [Gordonia crocea]
MIMAATSTVAAAAAVAALTNDSVESVAVTESTAIHTETAHSPKAAATINVPHLKPYIRDSVASRSTLAGRTFGTNIVTCSKLGVSCVT